MNKIHRFLMVYMIVITILCGYMCYVAFYRKETRKEQLIHQVQSTVIRKEKEYRKTSTEKKRESYGLSVKDGNLVIVNNLTKEIFEYTDMKEEELSADILKMLKQKKIFKSREEVYHFLESYSS